MFRPRRILWLLGLCLLVGTAAGAGWMLNHPESGGDNGTSPPAAGAPGPSGIVAIGYVDVQPKVADLYPLQPGRITWVVAEGTHVAKGAVLLKQDDRLAKVELKRAEAALKNANQQLAQAKLLPRQHPEKLKQLQAAVAAAKADKATAEQVAEVKHRGAVVNKVIPMEEYEIAKEAIKKAEAQIQAEESKLREAQLFEPDLEVTRAEADVAAKEALADKARLAVDECRLLAPSDGDVLRVLTAVGEPGANPRSPALQFVPKTDRIIRAEIQQEFAAKVRVGQEAVIVDDTTTGAQWRGRVKSLSDWYTNRRSVVQEPFQLNDVRTLECLVELTGAGQQPLRIGQRVRVTIKQGGP
jgi:multidrug resistance efflux pump